MRGQREAHRQEAESLRATAEEARRVAEKARLEAADLRKRYEEQGRLLVAVQRALDDLKHARNR